MRKGLNMKMAAMGLALASMVACTGKTTTDATCCAANGGGQLSRRNLPQRMHERM